MALVIAVLNGKGGVGKTTTVANLGVALSQAGFETLLVDLDPQGSLAVCLGVHENLVARTVQTALLDDGSDLSAAIHKVRPHLHMIPSHVRLAEAELAIALQINREYLLRRALKHIGPEFDFVLIDCSATLGLISTNALTAADYLLIPMRTDFLAVRSVRQTLRVAESVRSLCNPDLAVLGILPTMHSARQVHDRAALKEANLFGVPVLPVAIPNSVQFSQTPLRGRTLLEVAPDHPGAYAYRRLADEVMALYGSTQQRMPVRAAA